MTLNPFLCIDLSISDSLRSVRKSVLIYETIIVPIDAFFWNQAIIDDNENLYVGNHVFKDIWIIISSQDGQIQL